MFKTLGIVKGALLTEKQRRQLARRLDGKSVLEWVVRLMTECMQIDAVVVLTDNAEDGDIAAKNCPIDVPLVRSDASDTLGCLVDVLNQFPSESVVFIGADWPFLDPTIIDRLVNTAECEPNCDYAAHQFTNECFSAGRPYGIFPEWYRAETLRKINDKTDDLIHRQLPGTFFLDNQKHFTIELLPAPVGYDRSDIRLTVSDENDWENVLEIHGALDMDACDAGKVFNLIQHQPHMREQMARANEQALAETR